MNYEKKYIVLKNQFGNAPTNILYHGTSSYFIDNIKIKGLCYFPEDLIKDIEFAYN